MVAYRLPYSSSSALSSNYHIVIIVTLLLSSHCHYRLIVIIVTSLSSSHCHHYHIIITIIQMIIIVMIRDKHGKEQIVCLADDHRKNRHHTSLFVRNCKLVRSLTSSSALFCHCLPSFSSSSYFERNQAIRFPLSSTILNGKVSDKYLQK